MAIDILLWNVLLPIQRCCAASCQDLSTLAVGALRWLIPNATCIYSSYCYTNDVTIYYYIITYLYIVAVFLNVYLLCLYLFDARGPRHMEVLYLLLPQSIKYCVCLLSYLRFR